MRTRQLGSSELVVSEVGFGAWTLASKWWGEVDDPAALVAAALDAGITFFDTAPVYGDDGAGETILAGALGNHIEEIVLTTKCGYDIGAERVGGGHNERPHDWTPRGVRTQLEDSLRRLGRDRIDLYQLHNTTMDPILADDLWAELEVLRGEGKIRELGVALGPAIGWKDEGVYALDHRPVVSVQSVFNILEQEPGRTFLEHPTVQGGRASVIARVPHASDVLSGKVTRDTVFAADDHRAFRNRDMLLDLCDKVERVHYLHDGDTGRTIGQAAIAGILSFPGIATVLPTCTTAEQVREYAAASDMPLDDHERARLADEWSRNFGVVDRYTAPQRSSATA
jgi:aryl-alcohol dehydrogenase-like predicted oxidoreductase